MLLGSGINDLPVVTDWEEGSEHVFLVQGRLNERYGDHPYYPLPTDGFFDDVCCHVALRFQKEKLGIDSPNLTKGFFSALDLGDMRDEWARFRGMSQWPKMGEACAYMYNAPPPPVQGKPFSWKALAIGAGAVAFGLGVALLLIKGGKRGR